jgi:3-hydroxypropanoate dehydrogenase
VGEKINDAALDILFRSARSQNKWKDTPVSDEQLREIYDIMKCGSTSTNCCPARLVFCRTEESKARVAAVAAEPNQAKIISAPVVAIVGYDTEFHEHMMTLFAIRPQFKDVYGGDDQLRETTAFRNGTLQGAYLIMAIRAMGLDAGPLSGFNNAACDAEFFPDGRIKSNFICGIGHGDREGLFPRHFRFPFEDVCTLV